MHVGAVSATRGLVLLMGCPADLVVGCLASLVTSPTGTADQTTQHPVLSYRFQRPGPEGLAPPLTRVLDRSPVRAARIPFNSHRHRPSGFASVTNLQCGLVRRDSVCYAVGSTTRASHDQGVKGKIADQHGGVTVRIGGFPHSRGTDRHGLQTSSRCADCLEQQAHPHRMDWLHEDL